MCDEMGGRGDGPLGGRIVGAETAWRWGAMDARCGASHYQLGDPGLPVFRRQTVAGTTAREGMA